MAELKALIFDQDGVLADTERDGHLVAFNQSILEHGQTFQWDEDTYKRLLKVGGGKERLRKYFSEDLNITLDDTMKAVIKNIHRRKTAIFMRLIRKGRIGLRSGIARLVKEAHDAGIRLAICSTSNEDAVNTLALNLLGEEAYGWFDPILAGDVVTKKKPDPEIYRMARERLGLTPEECMVIEDSRNGLLAAKGAGMRCAITVNNYTRDEDFAEADIVVTCLGDAEGEKSEILAGGEGIPFDGLVTLFTLREIMGQV